jgi:hypothetical protein
MISLTINIENTRQIAAVSQALYQLLTAETAAETPASAPAATTLAPTPVEPVAPKKRKSAAATPAADETPPATAETATESPSDPKPAAASTAPETPAAQPASSPASAVTLEQVRAKLAALSQGGKMAEVKGILSGLGYAKLTDVPADKYATVLEKAEAL